MDTTRLFMKQKMQNKSHLSLTIWIMALIAIGGIIDSLTKQEINTWYSTLHRARLTPPNYVFPVAWTILYGIIGACGWLIWCASLFTKVSAPLRGKSKSALAR
jgi:benzodiazapine receptor